MEPAAAKVARQAEERAGAAVVGVSEIEFLDHPTAASSRASSCAATWPRRSAGSVRTSSSPSTTANDGATTPAPGGTAPITEPSAGRPSMRSPTPGTAGSSPTSPRRRGPGCNGSPSPTRGRRPMPSMSRRSLDTAVASLAAHEQYLRGDRYRRRPNLRHGAPPQPDQQRRRALRWPTRRGIRTDPRPGGTGVSERRRVSSGSPFEATVGYCRAVAVGDRIFVSARPALAGRHGRPGAGEQARVEIETEAVSSGR